jgi:prepilin-type N-terminal cleavage/methylation domain-containing protein
LTVAIRPPKYNSQGFTLIEMIVTVMFAGILMAMATPSLLSLNKPLRDGSLQFKSQLSLIRSKAISSSKAYRIRPKSTALTDYPDGVARNFVVEYADNCKMPENDATPATLRWQMASQFDLDLPPNIGIATTGTTLALTKPAIAAIAEIPGPPIVPAVPAVPAEIRSVSPSLDWKTIGSRICFDNRGIIETGNTKIVLQDFQGFNKARLAEVELTTVGNVDIKTYIQVTSSAFTAIVPTNSDNPEF